MLTITPIILKKILLNKKKQKNNIIKYETKTKFVHKKQLQT